MPSKRPIIIALLLFTWSIISYFLLIRQTTFDSQNRISRVPNDPISASELRAVQNQLNDLEKGIQEESRQHDYLVKKWLQLLKSSKESEQRKNSLESTAGNENEKKQLNVIGSIAKSETDNNNEAKTNEIDFVNAIPVGEESSTNADSQTILHYKLKKLTKDYLNVVDFNGPVIPILVFACNRISVRNCLENLIRYRPNARQFPIIVSQVSFNFYSFSLIFLNAEILFNGFCGKYFLFIHLMNEFEECLSLR